jgi:hypothetical protein
LNKWKPIIWPKRYRIFNKLVGLHINRCMTLSDWLDRLAKGEKYLFINTRPSWYKLIMVIPIVKFMLHDSLACKRVYGGGYLLDGKRQAYFTRNTSNLPLTYLHSLIVAGHLAFLLWNRRSDRQIGSAVMKVSPSRSWRCLDCLGRWTVGEKFLAGVVVRVWTGVKLWRTGHSGLWLRA